MNHALMRPLYKEGIIISTAQIRLMCQIYLKSDGVTPTRIMDFARDLKCVEIHHFQVFIFIINKWCLKWEVISINYYPRWDYPTLGQVTYLASMIDMVFNAIGADKKMWCLLATKILTFFRLFVARIYQGICGVPRHHILNRPAWKT